MILIFINLFIIIIAARRVPPVKEFLLDTTAYSSHSRQILNTKRQSKNQIIHQQVIDNIEISLYSNGTAIVVGEGDMRNYSKTTSPFYPHRQTIINVKIDDRIRSIGRFSFFGCSELQQISFGPNLHTIYESAFTNCFNLRSLLFENEHTKCSTKLISKESSDLIFDEEEFKFCHEIFECSKNQNSKSLNCSVHQTKTFSEHQSNSPRNNIKHQADNLQYTNQHIKDIYTGSCGDNVQYSIDTSTYETRIWGSGPMSDYQYRNSPFSQNCQFIKSISISDGVTSIGTYAFSLCSSFKSITIPNKVTSIGESAFGDCSSLTSISLPNSVTSIGTSAFVRCRNLTSITIPNSVRSIGTSAFAVCSSLTSISLTNGVTSIGTSAFSSCSSLTSITIPNSVTSIGTHTFFTCSSLTSIIISYSLTSIGPYTFSGCSSLTSITIPNCVTSIGEGTFLDCSNLTSITISNGVRSIGTSAFQRCSSLKSITIPNCVTSIEKSTFVDCSSLTSITISKRVRSIGNYAFLRCSKLVDVNYFGECDPIYADDSFPNCRISYVNVVKSYKNDRFCGYSVRKVLTDLPIPSCLFTNSNYFTSSNVFSLSQSFTRSVEFSNSFIFTKSILFSESDLFIDSIPDSLSNSNFLSKSNHFTSNQIFSNSLQFSFSSLFSQSNPFSAGDIVDADTQSTSNKQSKMKIIIIISVSIGLLIIIAVCTTTIICIRKKSNYKEEKMEYSLSEKSEKNPPILQTLISPSIF